MPAGTLKPGASNASVVALRQRLIATGELGETKRRGHAPSSRYDAQVVHADEYPACPEWTPRERLVGEREALGFYLTGHPLERFAQDVERFATTSIGALRREQSGAATASTTWIGRAVAFE